MGTKHGDPIEAGNTREGSPIENQGVPLSTIYPSSTEIIYLSGSINADGNSILCIGVVVSDGVSPNSIAYRRKHVLPTEVEMQ